ncbi:unnamed protein product [Larinioides sclopetarius]|uniref:Uncharacterized protein n=1 Tax=Larinioides sclopetarius TaxID=280406 RepID=A0AAV1ZLQ1_9ARAC
MRSLVVIASSAEAEVLLAQHRATTRPLPKDELARTDGEKKPLLFCTYKG